MRRIAYIGEKGDFYKFISFAFDGEVIEYSGMDASGADALRFEYSDHGKGSPSEWRLDARV